MNTSLVKSVLSNMDDETLQHTDAVIVALVTRIKSLRRALYSIAIATTEARKKTHEPTSE